MRKLCARGYTESGLDAHDVARFPRELTELEIPLPRSIFSLAPSASLLEWPTTLNRLTVNLLPMLLWKWLPQTLTILEIEYIPSKDLVSAYPNDPSREDLLKVCFEDLPRNLTHLRTAFAETTLISWPGVSETGRITLNSGEEISRLFPPKLKVLDCQNASFSLEAAKHIPRSVTELNILLLNPDICAALPRHLTDLLVSGCIVAPELIKNLPRSLTRLSMPLARDEQEWIFEETGQTATFAALVKLDPEKYGHKTEDLSMLWQGEYVFPSTLTHLELSGHEYLDDRFVASLPTKLNFGDFQSSLFISDLSIPAFSRELTTLDLASTTLVTSHSFKDLPRRLWWLSINSSEEIFDEHIKDLPRGLGALFLENAIHLTNSCVKDLPPTIEELSMRRNRLITPSSFPDFPARMRNTSIYNSFSAATWMIDNGEITEINEEDEENDEADEAEEADE
jgi:hypothetical protein